MSYYSFNPEDFKNAEKKPKSRSLRKAFSEWIIENHGQDYIEELVRQRGRKENAGLKRMLSRDAKKVDDQPLVGIVGGGFAGMYAGLILQSLGIEFEIFESSDRVGGRIDTWYSDDYDAKDPNKAGLYGEVGGMRVPQFSEDMLPVQHLALAVNSVLDRNKMSDKKVNWRKFYYNSDVQRMRYNNMEAPIMASESSLNSLNFGRDEGGDIDMVWLTPVQSADGKESYLPINKILDMVNGPFIEKINKSFSEGFAKLMKFDNYSMWAYLTNVFTLGDLGDYYQEAMGATTDHLSYNVTSYLETLNVGTGMYSVSFVEMVIAVYDWGGSKNPYDKTDQDIYMVTVDKGMQHFPDACRTVLDLQDGVLPEDGLNAQMTIGMIDGINGQKGYSPDNLTPAAEPPETVPPAEANPPVKGEPSVAKKRVFLNHKVREIKHDESLYDGYGGMKVAIEAHDEIVEKDYPFVISTLPNGAYLSGDLKTNFFDDLSFSKARAIRECNYMPAFKAFITFKTQFWAEAGNRQDKGLGVGTSDRSNRQIVYPSYGYDSEGGVLQVYCWAQDAERLGALTDEERVNECLKGIAYLYPDQDVYGSFAGYDPGVNTKTWFWDNHAGGGAFALFSPGQFKTLYPTLLTPEFNGSLNIAGECCSVHHGWIVGALDSAYNAVNNILQHLGDDEKIAQMEKTWGQLSAPDVTLRPEVTSALV
ncbi:FAD-dependent oxidoreductase [Saprospiraceae bacterium]|nr:FAD-dependent oxidoreductase [Saprospiraceae bacterium]